MGKPPFFEGTRYNQWKTKMFGYLNAIHKNLWKVVEVGCEILGHSSPLQHHCNNMYYKETFKPCTSFTHP